MLTESQVDDLWVRATEAEARSAYYGSLANSYTARKHWVTGLNLVLGSAAVITAFAESGPWPLAVIGLLVTCLNAYSVAVGLDRLPFELSTLHAQWQELSDDYLDLWSKHWEEGAEITRRELIRRDREVSHASTRAPHKEKLANSWFERIFARSEEARA